MRRDLISNRVVSRIRTGDVYELDHDLLEEIKEEEKLESEKDEERMEEFVEEAVTRFRGLSRNTAIDMWREVKDDYSGKELEREFSKKLRNSDRIQNYIDKYFGDRPHVVYKFRDVRTDPDYREGDAVDSIARMATKYFKEKELEKSREPLREEIPEEIREWLPDKLVVRVGDNNEIEEVTDRFFQKRETIRKKVAQIKKLIQDYNDIAKKVKNDLKNKTGKTRLAALVTSIMMETGIRPGAAGNSAVQVTEDGDKIEVETFGAVTLKKEHVDFVRDDFAELEFRGKKGEINFAELGDSEIISILEEYVEDAREEGSDYIFVTKDGERFTYNDLRDYLGERWPYISPTDFRKRMATYVTLRSLHEKQKDLYKDLQKFVDQEADELKQKVADRVADTIGESLREAQEALSHKDVSTTLQSYVNPEVILRFLSKGEIEDNLEDAIITNQRKLEFDPETFIEKADKMSSRIKQSGEITLKDVKEMLEEDMEKIDELEDGDDKTSKIARRVADRVKISKQKEYYNMGQKDPTLEEVACLWSQEKKQARDDHIHGYFPLRKLLPYREYKWKRADSRPGFALVDGEQRYFEKGERKWDALKRDMMENGWRKDQQPALMDIGRDGKAQISEGNHRLAIAKEIGLKKIPVRFFFQSGEVRGDQLCNQ